jgi:hypothetical protein
MPSRKIKRTLILPGLRANLLQERARRSLLGLHTPIVRRTHDNIGIQAPAHVQEFKAIGSTICHVHPPARCRRGTTVLSAVVPDIVVLLALAPVCASFPLGSREANAGMLRGTPQHLWAVRFDGQDGLQGRPTPVPIADFSQATCLAAMAQIQVRRVLDQQDERQPLHPAFVSVANAAASAHRR